MRSATPVRRIYKLSGPEKCRLSWSEDALVVEVAGHIREALPAGTPQPVWGIVLGSGLGEVLPALDGEVRLDMRDIPHMRAPRVPGQAGNISFGVLDGTPCLVQRGRRHLYEGCGMDAVTFSVRVQAELGVSHLALTNAAGALNPVYEPGDCMVIRDHINLMGSNPLTGVEEADGSPAFLDLSAAYDEQLSELAMGVAKVEGMRVEEGVYVAVPGPSYETGAELRYMRVIGGDAVGMSTVPEVLAARLLGVRVLGISCITNIWDLRRPHPASHLQVLETAGKAAPGLGLLLRRVIQQSEMARQMKEKEI